jgi:regulator of sirC expression with transglutaminase-like and TPR domain
MELQAAVELSMSLHVKTFHLSHARARELLNRGLTATPPRLDWSACSVASLVDDDFVVEDVEKALDGLGQRVQEGLTHAVDAAGQLGALRQVLVEEEGFFGGSSVDDAPVNSALHHVLTRKTGLPITLSVLYLEVARRAGLTLVGVSFPAHFLVATPGPGERLVLDPFNNGQLLNGNGCEELLARVAPAVRFSPRLLSAASVQTITTRMLSNLKRSYLARGDGERALNVVDLLLLLAPDHPGELRVRAGILSALGAYQAALVDVERCLELSPDAPDQRHLRLAARTLKQHVDYLN